MNEVPVHTPERKKEEGTPLKREKVKKAPTRGWHPLHTSTVSDVNEEKSHIVSFSIGVANDDEMEEKEEKEKEKREEERMCHAPKTPHPLQRYRRVVESTLPTPLSSTFQCSLS